MTRIQSLSCLSTRYDVCEIGYTPGNAATDGFSVTGLGKGTEFVEPEGSDWPKGLAIGSASNDIVAGL